MFANRPAGVYDKLAAFQGRLEVSDAVGVIDAVVGENRKCTHKREL